MTSPSVPSPKSDSPVGSDRRDAAHVDANVAIELAAEGVDVTIDNNHILHCVDLVVRAGELVALLGPNGAGKSTLLAALAGDRNIDHGQITVNGDDINTIAALELARRRAVLPQTTTVSFPFTVREIVEMGRAPWARTADAGRDDEVIESSLEVTDVAHLADRRFPTLSGGERGRVAMARALAQRTPILLLDEPTAALDLHHQQLVLQLARKRADAGDAVVIVLHDLALAAAHVDRTVLLSAGRVVADGDPETVFEADLLGSVYNHPVEVLPHPRTGVPLVLPRTDTDI